MEQIAALSAHVEKLMMMLRAETASKGSSQEEVRLLKRKLGEEKARSAGLMAEKSALEHSRKGLEHHDKMLNKQLDMMDAKCSDLMRTHQFKREKEAKLVAGLRKDLHDVNKKKFILAQALREAATRRMNAISGVAKLVESLYGVDASGAKVSGTKFGNISGAIGESDG